jgi:hypothetical protein
MGDDLVFGLVMILLLAFLGGLFAPSRGPRRRLR